MLNALAAGASVVTANSRLARSLALAFNRGQRLAGAAAWRAPDVLSWQAWLGKLWARSIEIDGVAGGRLLLTDVQQRALWSEVVGDAAELPGDRLAAARAAAGAWQLCQNWRIATGDLVAEADSDDTRVFADWADAYQERCRARGWADSGMLASLLATDVQQGKLRPAREIHFVGFEDWTPAQRELLRVLAAAGCRLHEQPAPHAEGAGAHRIACHDAPEELELAARWARRRLEADAASVIGVVVPDLSSRLPAVRRAFLDVFAPDWRLSPGCELPVNFSYGEPLAGFGVIHVALLLLKALSGSLKFQEAGQLLRAPYLPGGSTESGARAALEIALRDDAGPEIDVGALINQCRKSAPVFSDMLGRLSASIRNAPRTQRASAWADSFDAALKAGGWPGDRPLGSDEFQAVEAWREQMDALRGCDRLGGRLGFRVALGLLGSMVSEQLFQPAGHPDGVQVLGTLEALGQQFDALWICGLSSAAWPPATRPDPLLPLSLQRRLRMPESSPPFARERAERRLRWLLSSAPEVTVSWPQFAGDEPLTPSPLIAHLPEQERAGLDLWTPPLWRESLLLVDATEPVIDDPAPPVDPQVRMRGGARLLELQARCPARAFLEIRLGARELAVPEPGIDAMKRGTITHAVLQEFYRRVGSHEQLCDLSTAEAGAMLDGIIAAVLRKELRQEDAFSRRLALQEHQRLARLIEKFLETERARAPFKVMATEQLLSAANGPPSIAQLGLRLKVDRIDAVADGRRLVIDYKTGSLPGKKELWGPRPRSPQLPLYATLTDAHGIAFVQLSAKGVEWLGIGHEAWDIDGIVEPDELEKNSPADWAALRGSWWEALDRLGSEILAGDFRIDRWRHDQAKGQWAMATRAHELEDEEEPAT